jgi:two-component system, NarL family, nitrate/nitrite response regulator NarL
MSKANKIRILIGDRQPIFRNGLNRLLSQQPDITVVGEVEDAKQALKLADEKKPSILLLDSMLVERDGQDFIRELQQKHKQLRIIFMTPSERADDSSAVLRKMAAGILSKQVPLEGLLQCIHKVDSGEPWTQAPSVNSFSVMPGAQNSHFAGMAKEHSPLSFREKQVVAMVAQGYRNKEIAERMFISEQTVKNHLHNIFDKLGVSDRLELALYAIHKNLQAAE